MYFTTHFGVLLLNLTFSGWNTTVILNTNVQFGVEQGLH